MKRLQFITIILFSVISYSIFAQPTNNQTTAPSEDSKTSKDGNLENSSKEKTSDNEGKESAVEESSSEVEDSEENKKWSRTEIQVIGNKKGDLKRIPGSATIVGKEFLDQNRPTDATEVMRRIPGSSIRYQDPAGLTLNLGFRGISSEVSRKVLVLEDGVPVSLNPYGEPEMYYVPSIERMERIEVVKGSGSILFGPSTIGGVVNFVTRRPPIEPTLTSTTIGGENGYFSQYLAYGGTFGNTGFDISVLRKQGDGFRDHQSFFVNEVNLKTITQLNEKHAFTTKIGMHQQEANITYIGQTTAQFWNNPKFNAAEQDVREIERYQTVLGHEYTISDKARVVTKFYANQTKRNWARQNYSRNVRLGERKPSDTVAEYDSEPYGDRVGDTVWMRGANAFRNRRYRSLGLETKLELDFDLLSMNHQIDMGARYHYDYAEAQLLTGPLTPDYAIWPNNDLSRTPTLISSPYSLAKSGELRDDEVRQAKALAVFIQDRIGITDRFAIIPGVRHETISQTRLIRRRRANFNPDTFAVSGNTVAQIDREGKNQTSVVIPGFGTTYDITRDFTWFAGVHKGFAPARYESAISPDGEDIALKPETSWNYESGVRGKLTKYYQVQLTGYMLDFNDQIINSSAAGGNFGSRPVNAGRSIHKGVEVDMVFDFGKFNGIKWDIPFEVIYSRNEAKSNQYTYNLKALLDGNLDPRQQVDTNGNMLPYVSRDVVSISLGTKAPNGFYVRGEWQYFSKQYHDLENTNTFYGYDRYAAASSDIARTGTYLGYASDANGLNGVIPAHELVHISIGLQKETWSIFLVAKNILDRKYISSRLPEGIQPGPFRQVNLGLSLYL
ncbi:TonB-dependent receptor family protein [Leptospira sp. GIMC2001]|uniref:TonB-dependent receptor family protein n=1 Tax=Leptospira sp. GIMC2001 TaxID=1513297 RepID=UPI00234BE31D|nr:TonB-dependent receptor [Leptospira sp. GIMC2001]WCL48832.1 TonB-dependent receptor [Leptospira sp. GIMC2001]